MGVLGKESPGSHVYHRLATLPMLSLFLTLMCVRLCCVLFLMNTKAAVILWCLPPRLGKRVHQKGSDEYLAGWQVVGPQ